MIESSSRLQRVQEAAGLLAACAVGIVLRTGSAAASGLWLDEFQTDWLCSGGQGSAGAVIERCSAQMTQVPLYHLATRLSMEFFGRNEWALRLPALLAGCAAIPVVFFLARRLFGPRTAAAAAMILAVATPQVDASTWARPYSLMVLLGLCSTLCYANWLAAPRRRTLVLYAAATALLLFTHLLAAPLVAAHAGHALAVRGRKAGPLLAAQGLAAAALLPFAGQIAALARSNAEFAYAGGSQAQLLLRHLEHHVEPLPHLLALASIVLLALVGAFGAKQRAAPLEAPPGAGLGLAAALLAVLAGAPLLLDAGGVRVLSSPRYLALAAIPIVLLLARLLVAAAGGARRARGFAAPLVLPPIFLVAARVPAAPPAAADFRVPSLSEWTAGIAEISAARFFRPAPLEDWRGAIQDLNRRSRDGESVYVFTGYVEANLERFVRDPVLGDYLKGPLGGFYLRRALAVHLLPPDPFDPDHQIDWQAALRRERGPFWMLGRDWPGFRAELEFFRKLDPQRAWWRPLPGREQGYDGGIVLLRCGVGPAGAPF